MMRRALLLTLLLLCATTAGCLGGEERTQWAFDVTQLGAAYGQGHRGEGVVVAVLDTGINLGHPALTHLDDGKEGNGEVIAFRDFLGSANGVEAAFDDDGHGSHVAGILSARGSSFGDKLTNGGVDLLGASPEVQLVVARVCDHESCEADRIDDAVRWAMQQDADIISMSLGGTGGFELGAGGISLAQDDISRAINDAIDRGVVVIASAGNDDRDSDDVAFPACIEGVIAVGAVNKGLRVATFSNRGNDRDDVCTGSVLGNERSPPNQKPEVVAPGTDILSAWTSNTYVRASGTSQATPFAAAVVAIMLEGKPDLDSRSDVLQVKSVLRSTARTLDSQDTPHDAGAGYGLVQATAAKDAYQG